ncbi:MAG: ribosome biogenesis GTPase Der [Candidatus Peribacteraceae bacterium]|jgi:GTP-binding protein
MAKLPTVAIIGRPNTGKSTLFNQLIGHRKAIVSEIPGTTRDHVAQRVETDELDYLLVDTGGMGGGTADKDFEDDVHAQSMLAIGNADVILLTINSKEDLTSSDFEIVDLLRKKRRTHVPILLVLTKCDNPAITQELLPQYYALGIADVIVPVSAPHNIGLDNLQSHIIDTLTALNFRKQESDGSLPRISIIGRTNVGKSSLINAMMSETQLATSPLLVSEVPGTTRDATDTVIQFNDRSYLFMDTAGIKKRTQTDKGVETFAYFRSIQALEEADIAVLVLDATAPVSRQDKRIASLATEEGKGLIVLLNKSDMLAGEQRTKALEDARIALPFCKFAPFLLCSAQTRKDLVKIFDLIALVQENRSRRIPTKALNAWMRDAVYGKGLGPVSDAKYITQAEELPPTFVLFVKNPKHIHVSQLRYLENTLRKTYAFEGVPMRWITKDTREHRDE